MAAVLLGLALVMLAVAGIAKAAVDVLMHQEDKNIFIKLGPWWDARTSWKRKYKDYDAGDLRPCFIGAKTWLVSLTDFWHAADAVYLLTYAAGFALIGFTCASVPLPVLKLVTVSVLGRLVFSGVFEVFYKHVFRIKSIGAN